MIKIFHSEYEIHDISIQIYHHSRDDESNALNRNTEEGKLSFFLYSLIFFH